ncbi:hypothetical protein AG1IA_08614 [Rhizoctonia solani AG-1 IA]|uniref:Uncharacterized protein n=1 Tax=Thanatephorus cucumeris (strain AG1-IA) TaxID=983506 RepID=L8WGQ5_THACA|nr:hypothetical protein AG1IA_08614 [Rhizoctonia solani AG-1 IA]
MYNSLLLRQELLFTKNASEAWSVRLVQKATEVFKHTLDLEVMIKVPLMMGDNPMSRRKCAGVVTYFQARRFRVPNNMPSFIIAFGAYGLVCTSPNPISKLVNKLVDRHSVVLCIRYLEPGNSCNCFPRRCHNVEARVSKCSNVQLPSSTLNVYELIQVRMDRVLPGWVHGHQWPIEDLKTAGHAPLLTAINLTDVLSISS